MSHSPSLSSSQEYLSPHTGREGMGSRSADQRAAMMLHIRSRLAEKLRRYPAILLDLVQQRRTQERAVEQGRLSRTSFPALIAENREMLASIGVDPDASTLPSALSLACSDYAAEEPRILLLMKRITRRPTLHQRILDLLEELGGYAWVISDLQVGLAITEMGIDVHSQKDRRLFRLVVGRLHINAIERGGN